jgi:hypothetical protein
MDRQVEVENPSEKSAYSSGHLMCRTAIWGIAGFVGCGYFAWLSFTHIMHHEYDWPHDTWTAATYVVWILLLLGLTLDTRCLRERFFFGLLVANFLIGFGLTVWRTAPVSDVRLARLVTGVLWMAAALASLMTLGGMRGADKKSA